MTTYEIVTTIIIWIAYGVFAAYKSDNMDCIMLYIMFSPPIFVVRCLLGAFYYKY